MANLPKPKITHVEAHSQYVTSFEVDTLTNKVKVVAIDRDEDGVMIPGSARISKWVSMFDEDGIPDLPGVTIEEFVQCTYLLTKLTVAIAKKAGVVDADAEAVLPELPG